MKKNLLSVLFLTIGILLVSCGGMDQKTGRSSDAAGNVSQTAPEAGGETGTGMGQQPVGGGAEDDPVGTDASGSEKEGGESWEEEDVFLSDQILDAGDTMQVMYYQDENTLCHGLDITLHKAGLYDSPEAAGLGGAELVEETEVYGKDGNPKMCGTAGMRILSCDLTVQNIDDAEGGEQHISTIMLAYADPSTRKVSIVSCAPVYFSASSSETGEGDYYHYQLPKGDGRDMTVAWGVPEEYEGENLYLCVTYDSREPEERQYFRLAEGK